MVLRLLFGSRAGGFYILGGGFVCDLHVSLLVLQG